MAKREAEERPEWETSNIALLMYTALMILLLAFFIMLNSMAVVDEKREIKAIGSLIGSFGILPGGLSPAQDDARNVAPSTSPLQVIQRDMDLIKEALKNRVAAEKFNVLRGRTRRIISLDAAVLFPVDGVEILPEMKPALMDVARILKSGQYPVVIEAHTDDRPPSSEKYTDNWQVSALRAVNVLRFLVEDGGVDPERLSAYGYGGFKPLAANTSPENRRRNNRVDLILDQTQKIRVRNFEDRRKPTTIFDFKGFNFNLFGDEKK